jgi:hypothetical protein
MITDIKRRTKTTFEIESNASLSPEDRAIAQLRLRNLFKGFGTVELGATQQCGHGTFALIEIEDCTQTNAEIKRIVEGVFRTFVH